MAADPARKGAHSVAPPRGAFTIAPSPLNPVKLELGLLVLLALPVALLCVRWLGRGAGLAVAAAYGAGAALWLVWRTRRLLRALERGEGA
ncbi:hypothetical protein [Inmirania thermothiophila]|uniref:hypothetical protein n=1 Tax=Inmirania thermothiophila TaxID=1750597 RepID=UPI000F46FD25|nr:hypothetical protein [Inmirania thermothiophila]